MTGKKSWGSTVAGWFVVQEDSAVPEPGAPAPLSGQDSAGTDAAPTFVKDVPAARGGQVDFDAVFDAAGISSEMRSHCDKASELMATLPTDTDASVKKRIVEASLKAFGVPIEKIIEAGVHEIQALEGYLQADSRDTRNVIAESQRRIAEHEAEIRQINTVMEQRTQEQQSVVKSCNERKLDIQRVLEFFGQEAVARVVRDSPKLITPSEQKAK
jgi:hypothetical protein